MGLRLTKIVSAVFLYCFAVCGLLPFSVSLRVFQLSHSASAFVPIADSKLSVSGMAGESVAGHAAKDHRQDRKILLAREKTLVDSSDGMRVLSFLSDAGEMPGVFFEKENGSYYLCESCEGSIHRNTFHPIDSSKSPPYLKV